MRPIKSNDPRKPAILAALKRVSRCTKITNVCENGGTGELGQFSGDGLLYAGGKYQNMGTFYVSMETVFPTEVSHGIV